LSASDKPQRIELFGEYDINRRSEVVLLFESLTAEGPVEVDMTRVTYVDSTFLHALTALHFRFKPWGVTLAGVSPQIRRVLQMMDFEKLFRIADEE
jgi:anti-anti-sigma factor